MLLRKVERQRWTAFLQVKGSRLVCVFPLLSWIQWLDRRCVSNAHTHQMQYCRKPKAGLCNQPCHLHSTVLLRTKVRRKNRGSSAIIKPISHYTCKVCPSYVVWNQELEYFGMLSLAFGHACARMANLPSCPHGQHGMALACEEKRHKHKKPQASQHQLFWVLLLSR